MASHKLIDTPKLIFALLCCGSSEAHALPLKERHRKERVLIFKTSDTTSNESQVQLDAFAKQARTLRERKTTNHSLIHHPFIQPNRQYAFATVHNQKQKIAYAL